MAIALRATSVGPSNNSTSTTISLPTGTTVGDVTIIAACQGADSNTLSAPSGWTTIVAGPAVCVCYRVFQSGDPSSVTVTSSGSAWFESLAISYSGCDTTTPIDNSNWCARIHNQYSDTIFRAPSLNPNWNSSQLVCVYARRNDGGGGAFTMPSGVTSRVSTTTGPTLAIGDKALTNGTATGNLDATGASDGAQLQFGCQIALKASGASAATLDAKRPEFGALWSIPQGFGSTVTVDLARLLVKDGDMVCIAIDTNGNTITPPSGYTLQQSTTYGFVYTKVWHTGDATSLTFTLGANAYTWTIACILRCTAAGAGSISCATSSEATGTGTATAPSLTPSTSYDFLACFWANNATSATTWTGQPTGITLEVVEGVGPSMIFAWNVPASNPTGTYTATNSNSAAVMAASLVFTLGSGGGGGSAKRRIVMVIAG